MRTGAIMLRVLVGCAVVAAGCSEASPPQDDRTSIVESEGATQVTASNDGVELWAEVVAWGLPPDEAQARADSAGYSEANGWDQIPDRSSDEPTVLSIAYEVTNRSDGPLVAFGPDGGFFNDLPIVLNDRGGIEISVSSRYPETVSFDTQPFVEGHRLDDGDRRRQLLVVPYPLEPEFSSADPSRSRELTLCVGLTDNLDGGQALDPEGDAGIEVGADYWPADDGPPSHEVCVMLSRPPGTDDDVADDDTTGGDDGPLGVGPSPLLTMGDEYELEDANARWRIRPEGVISIPSERKSTTCLAVVGTLTLDELVPEQLVSWPLSGWAWIDDEADDAGNASCDTASLTAAGYRPLADGLLVAGSTFPFFLSIEVDLDTDELAPIAIGWRVDGDGDEVLWFRPLLLDETPLAPIAESGPLPPARAPVAEVNVRVAGVFGEEVELELDGLIELPVTGKGDPGRCFALVGHATPQSNEPDSLRIGMFVDGTWVDSWHNRACDPEIELGPAGYLPYDFVGGEVPTGRHPVYFTLFAPGVDIETPTVVGLGHPNDDEPVFLEAVYLDEVPPLANG